RGQVGRGGRVGGASRDGRNHGNPCGDGAVGYVYGTVRVVANRLAATRSLRSGARVASRAPLRRLRVAAKRSYFPPSPPSSPSSSFGSPHTFSVNPSPSGWSVSGICTSASHT